MAKKRKKSAKQKKFVYKPHHFGILTVIIILLLSVIFFFFSTYNAFGQQNGNIVILWPNIDSKHPNLQLKTFAFITIAPTPTPIPIEGGAGGTAPSASSSAPGGDQQVGGGVLMEVPGLGAICMGDAIKTPGVVCRCGDMNAVACPVDMHKGGIVMQLPPAIGKPYNVTLGKPPILDPFPPSPSPGCYLACVAKPIVYLYPTQKTMVDVAVESPGRVFVSDPAYPKDGWKDVEAHPDGNLYYKNKNYKELFYETSLTRDVPKPDTGLVLPTDTIEKQLRDITSRYGLVGKEQDEFLAYWVGVVKGMHTPYVFFSVLTPQEKDAIDRLTITPNPETRIEFIAYFSPLPKQIEVNPLVMPEHPPVRKGFTMVEWGGTVGR